VNTPLGRFATCLRDTWLRASPQAGFIGWGEVHHYVLSSLARPRSVRLAIRVPAAWSSQEKPTRPETAAHTTPTWLWSWYQARRRKFRCSEGV